jgi:ubiquinone biosynthesis protein COQ9
LIILCTGKAAQAKDNSTTSQDTTRKRKSYLDGGGPANGNPSSTSGQGLPEAESDLVQYLRKKHERKEKLKQADTMVKEAAAKERQLEVEAQKLMIETARKLLEEGKSEAAAALLQVRRCQKIVSW